MSGNERPSFYRAVEDRPPYFITRNEAEKQRMFEWMCSRLHDWAEAYEWAGTHPDGLLEDELESVRAYFDYDAAVDAAERGDLGPLRARFPGHARFINLPRRADHSTWSTPAARPWPYPPGRAVRTLMEQMEQIPDDERDTQWQAKYDKIKRTVRTAERRDRIELAAAEAAIVRKIWKEYYKKSNQPRGRKNSQWTPEAIVAERWDVTVDEIERRQHRGL